MVDMRSLSAPDWWMDRAWEEGRGNSRLEKRVEAIHGRYLGKGERQFALEKRVEAIHAWSGLQKRERERERGHSRVAPFMVRMSSFLVRRTLTDSPRYLSVVISPASKFCCPTLISPKTPRRGNMLIEFGRWESISFPDAPLDQ